MKRVLFAPRPGQRLQSLVFLMSVLVTWLKWNLSLVFICIRLFFLDYYCYVDNTLKHLLDVCISSFENSGQVLGLPHACFDQAVSLFSFFSSSCVLDFDLSVECTIGKDSVLFHMLSLHVISTCLCFTDAY